MNAYVIGGLVCCAVGFFVPMPMVFTVILLFVGVMLMDYDPEEKTKK